MDRAGLTFRQAQAVFDLCHVARGAVAALPDGSRDLIARGCRFETDADLALHEHMSLVAADPAHAGFAAATAILLADLLQDGLGTDRLTWNYDTFTETYRAQPAGTRAALMNGFAALALYSTRGVPPVDLPIRPEDRITRPASAILPALRRIARGMDDDLLTSVSKADYGDQADRHKAALIRVLNDNDCLFGSDDTWFPSEVVELVAHVRATPGFIPCTALLLVNAIATGDDMGWFDFRWENLGPDYNALPGDARTPILAGLRYLYESDPDFLSYHTRPYDPALAPEWLIPVVPI